MRDLNKEYQDNDGRKYAYNFDQVLRNYMMRSFHPFFKDGPTLEMGCFEGDFTKVISEKFPLLTVIEGASDLIQVAKAKVPSNVQFVHTRFEDFSPEKKFDNIFLVHCLEHLDEPVKVLAKIRSWLTDGGRLFLAVPNANAPSRQIAVQMGLIAENQAVTPAEKEHGHRKTYVFDTLENEVRQSGLKVENRGGVFFKPLANFQFDKLMETNFLSKAYFDGCYELGMKYPDLCASIYLVCKK